MKPHPYKLRPYHNPEDVDESKVPDGWRFMYQYEPMRDPRRIWLPADVVDNPCFSRVTRGWSRTLKFTYIVPVS